MRRLQIIFLITALVFASGYRWRCYVACTDQTSVQNDYVEQRDHCREYAQLKVDMAMRENGGADDRSRKSQLVSLFSQCMGNNGWIVPDGKGEGGPKKVDAAAPPPAVAANPQAAVLTPLLVPPVNARSEEKAAITRASECAFARYSASFSSNAATRAAACDVECENALKAAPGAPRPASCPPDVSERLSKGHEN